MKIAAIIAEYNPFHSGHAYQIAETKRLTGSDFVIVVMSGDFVQRGAPAIFNKFERTRMALEGGADLVIELPVPYALSGAEGFAFGGVSLMEALSCVDVISFGSECGNVEKLQALADILVCEKTEFYNKKLKQLLKTGLSYPAARQQAFLAAYPELTDLGALLSSPNNILALEYLLALKRLNSPITPFTLKREGQAYHSTEQLSDVHPSASALRVQIEASRRNDVVLQDDFTPFLYAKLLSIPKESLLRVPDVSEEICNRILQLKKHYMTFTEFSAALKTKQYTKTRIDRILMRITLGTDVCSDIVLNTRSDIGSDLGVDIGSDVRSNCNLRPVSLPSAPFARVLGFRKEAAPMLKNIQEKASVPVILKLTQAEQSLKENPTGTCFFRQNMDTSSLYRILQEKKTGQTIPNEYETGLIIR